MRGQRHRFDAVVLAGGGGRRLGGVDKALLDYGGRSSLDRVLDAVDGALDVVVVGPERAVGQPVTWCREDPPGSGPVAALQTGLRHGDAPSVVLLAVDVPRVERRTVADLLAAAADHDGAVLVDAQGRDQFLVGAYSRAALTRAVVDLEPSAPMRRAIARMRLARVPDARGEADDADTWQQVERLREHW